MTGKYDLSDHLQLVLLFTWFDIFLKIENDVTWCLLLILVAGKSWQAKMLSTHWFADICCRWHVGVWIFCQVLSSRAVCLAGRTHTVGWYTQKFVFVLTFLSIRLVCVGENVFADIDFCISGLTFLGLVLLTQPSIICLYSVYISLSDCGSLCWPYIISVHDSGLLMCSCFF